MKCFFNNLTTINCIDQCCHDESNTIFSRLFHDNCIDASYARSSFLLNFTLLPKKKNKNCKTYPSLGVVGCESLLPQGQVNAHLPLCTHQNGTHS